MNWANAVCAKCAANSDFWFDTFDHDEGEKPEIYCTDCKDKSIDYNRRLIEMIERHKKELKELK